MGGVEIKENILYMKVQFWKKEYSDKYLTPSKAHATLIIGIGL